MNKKAIRGLSTLILCGLLVPVLTSDAMSVKAEEIDKYTPLTVQKGFNYDLVAEAQPAETTTNGSFDGSGENDNHVLFSEDYDSSLDGGLPKSGWVTSVSQPPVDYQLAPYNQNNALRLNQNDYQTGTLEFSEHGAYNKISILGASASGAAKINVTINYTDGTSSATKTFNSKEWFYMDGQVFSGIKRLSKNSLKTDGGESGPKLYQYQLDVDSTKKIKSIDFTQAILTAAEDDKKYSSSGDGSRADLSTTTVLMAVTGVGVKTPTLTTTEISTNEFLANWEKAPGVVQYTLDVATDAGFTQLVPGYDNKVVTGTSHVVTGLAPSTTYYYRIKTTNAAGVTLTSTYAEVKTVAMPTDVTPTPDTGTTGKTVVNTTKVASRPKTGDNSSMVSMLAILFTASTIGMVVTRHRKKS